MTTATGDDTAIPTGPGAHGSEAPVGRDGNRGGIRGADPSPAADPSLAADIARWRAMREMTREEEAKWVMGPIGPRDEIGALIDGHNVIYVDGQGNPLEPGWVLRVLRGDDVRAPMTAREVREHPWMAGRKR